mmetsp:Transcript_22454/g.58405  ORF Transcript_22454/g.58405 Transcript_22454/m.58405 type:complete len:279 (+) Transcript_22454:168-1004(+)
MQRVVALLLAAAATACGKDTDGGECQGFMRCALETAHEKLHAFNTGCANDAEETSSHVFGETAGGIVGDAIRTRMTDAPSTPATQSAITCKKEKGVKEAPCKKGDIVVDVANGVVCTFIKYKTNPKGWAECKNAHDFVGSYRPGGLRHATDGEKSVHKVAIDTYKLYKKNGGEEPPLPKVSKFADEGSAPDPAAVKKNTEYMRGLLKNGGYCGGIGGSAALDGDDLSVLLAMDQALSDMCIEERARKCRALAPAEGVQAHHHRFWPSRRRVARRPRAV